MENRLISASVSTQSVTFQPGGEPAWFDVIVNNDSNQFADFQLEILAAGSTNTPGYRWYMLSPEVASAQPPGSTTPFRILIQDTPIPGFVGTVNLTVRIYSPQLRTETRVVVRLKIEQGDRPTLLRVELPVVRVQVYPQNSVDVPVRVRNLGQTPIDVVLNFLDLDPSWIVKPLQRRVMVDPLGQAETTFQCQPPSANKILSQDYIYTVEATSRDNISAKAQGILEVLPIGFVEFSVDPQKQIIPSSRRWLPNWKSKSTTFKLLFKNASNLQQYVNVEVQGRNYQKCHFQVIPENAELNIGETTPVLLKVTTKRPWIGWGKTLLFEAKSILSNPSLGSTDPATQILELQVLPIIPLWLQLAILALLAALLALLQRLPPIVTHTDNVRAVRFNGDLTRIVSGSQDCTLRSWKLDSNILKPQGRVPEKAPVACGKSQNPTGLLGVTNVPVYSLRFMPQDSNRVAAGLENGEIQLWDLPTEQKQLRTKPKQKLKPAGVNMKFGQVFDLLFTKDSRSLLSGDGSGKILLWERPSPNGDFASNYKLIIDLEKQFNQSYQIQALALSPDEKTLVAAGSHRSFFIISNWNTKYPRVLEQKARDGQDTPENKYIHSIAFAPDSPNILATSDSFGFIGIWDLRQCLTNVASKQQIQKNCAQQLDRWDTRSGGVVRSIAFVNFNQDGGKLVSAGDDGRIMLWYLTPKGMLDKKFSKGNKIYPNFNQNSLGISAIDLNLKDQIVVSGSVDSQVKLHSIK